MVELLTIVETVVGETRELDPPPPLVSRLLAVVVGAENGADTRLDSSGTPLKKTKKMMSTTTIMITQGVHSQPEKNWQPSQSHCMESSLCGTMIIG